MWRTGGRPGPGRWITASFAPLKKTYDGRSIRARPKEPNPLWTRAWDALLAAAVLFAVWRLGSFILGPKNGPCNEKGRGSSCRGP